MIKSIDAILRRMLTAQGGTEILKSTESRDSIVQKILENFEDGYGLGFALGSSSVGAAGYLEVVATIPGDLSGQDEAVFGSFTFPVDGEFQQTTLDVLAAPTGSGITVDIVNSSGVEQSRVATLNAGETVQTTNITNLSAAAGSSWRFKIKSVGSTYAGDTLTVRCRVHLD